MLRRLRLLIAAIATAASVLGVVGGLAFEASPSPAFAATTCYLGSTTTRTHSYTFYNIVFHDSISYQPAYNCSRIQIGIRVVGGSASYTGGKASSTVGINEFGPSMNVTNGGTDCGGQLFDVLARKPAVRSISISYNITEYNGTYKTCTGASYPFQDVCIWTQVTGAASVDGVPVPLHAWLCSNGYFNHTVPNS